MRALIGGGDEESLRRADRLRNHYATGILWSSDYAGMWGDREIMERCTQSLAHEMSMPDLEEHIRFWRCCDFATLPQKALKFWTQRVDGGTSCLLENIHDRLVKPHSDWCQSCAPEKEMDGRIKVEAYDQILRYLLADPCNKYNRRAKAPCAIHGSCPLVPWAHRGPKRPDALLQHAVCNSTDWAQKFPSAVAAKLRNCDWEVSGEERPLLVLSAGLGSRCAAPCIIASQHHGIFAITAATCMHGTLCSQPCATALRFGLLCPLAPSRHDMHRMDPSGAAGAICRRE